MHIIIIKSLLTSLYPAPAGRRGDKGRNNPPLFRTQADSPRRRQSRCDPLPRPAPGGARGDFQKNVHSIMRLLITISCPHWKKYSYYKKYREHCKHAYGPPRYNIVNFGIYKISHYLSIINKREHIDEDKGEEQSI